MFVRANPPTPRKSRPPIAPLSTDDLMRIVVTLSVLGCCLGVILFGSYDDGTQKWAFGSIGAILGYWLRPVKKG